MPNLSRKPSDHPLLGISLMLGAVLAFAFMDVAMKLLVAEYPAIQVTFLRCAGSMPLFALAIIASGDREQFVSANLGLQIVRATIGILMLTSVGICFRELPLADAYAIFFAAPLLIVLLSGPLLGEAAGKRLVIAALLGFAGVLIVLKPEGQSLALSLGASMGLVGMLCYSFTSILLRRLGRQDSALTIAFYYTLLAGAGSAVLVWPVWQPIQRSDWVALAVLISAGTVAQFLISMAYRRASPATLAPFEYTAMIWALLFGYSMWRDIPGIRMIAGSIVVVAAGLYIIHHERQQTRTTV